MSDNYFAGATKPLSVVRTDSPMERIWKERDWEDLKHDLLVALKLHGEEELAEKLKKVEL